MHKIATSKNLSAIKPGIAGALAGAILMIAPCSGPAFAAGAVPSTFTTTIGSGLLCLDQIDPFYYWTYMNQFFGPPYKQEGGAYWFKVETTLWGAPISDVLVSDGSGRVDFLAVAATAKPEGLSDAILGSTGVGFVKEEASPYSPMVSSMGSKIIFFGENAKIFCAKHNPTYFQTHPE